MLGMSDDPRIDYIILAVIFASTILLAILPPAQWKTWCIRAFVAMLVIACGYVLSITFVSEYFGRWYLYFTAFSSIGIVLGLILRLCRLIYRKLKLADES